MYEVINSKHLTVVGRTRSSTIPYSVYNGQIESQDLFIPHYLDFSYRCHSITSLSYISLDYHCHYITLLIATVVI